MNETSAAENNQAQRRAIGGKSPSWRWILYLAMFLLFGFTVVGMLWYIFALGYEMRSQDWFLLGLNVLATLAAAGAFWEDWQKRKEKKDV